MPHNFLKRMLKGESRSFSTLIWVSLILFIPIYKMGYLDGALSFLKSPSLSLRFGETDITALKILQTTYIFVILLWLAGHIVHFGLVRIMRSQSLNDKTRRLLSNFFQVIIYAVVLIIGLEFSGINLTTLALLGGAIAMALGFGLQTIISNFMSGIILLFEDSINEGNLVQLEDGNIGYIRKIAARYTVIETFDGREIVSPNAELITHRLTNLTFSNRRGRIAIEVGVSYDSDLRQVEEILLASAKAHPRTIQNPSPAVFLRDFGDSAVIFRLHFWVDDVTEGLWGAEHDVRFAIWDAFKKEGIEIPYPQRVIHQANQ